MNIEELKPKFSFGKPNENVILTEEEPAEIISDEDKLTGQGKGILFLCRRASVKFEMHINTKNTEDMLSVHKNIAQCMQNNRKIKLKLVNRNVEISNGTIFSSNAFLPHDNMAVSWGALREPFCVYGNQNTEVDYISFHLFNGVDFFSDKSIREELNGGFWGIWLASLKWDNWEICIKDQKNTSDNINLLKENGGYALTHIGMIKKTDSSSFKIKDIQDLRSGLSFLLSFAMGRTCWPNLCIGYKNDRKVYEDWGAVVASWSDVGTWWHGTSIAKPHSSSLEELFPLFMNTWSNRGWQSALCEAIHWYFNSNDTNKLMLEPSLILQQAAIERLAFEYAVNDKKLISSEGFKKLIASDKYRLLFSSLGLPLPLPPELKSLLSIAKLRHWEDVPHALTEIRNSIVHPEHKQKGNFSDALHDTWRLSLECLELSILRICGYDGQYQSRVKTKQIPVPWCESKLTY